MDNRILSKLKQHHEGLTKRELKRSFSSGYREKFEGDFNRLVSAGVIERKGNRVLLAPQPEPNFPPQKENTENTKNPRFRVGEKVRVKNPQDYISIKKGDVGVVLSDDRTHCYGVAFPATSSRRSMELFFFNDNLERVRFKIGDRVRVLYTSYVTVKRGDTGVVVDDDYFHGQTVRLDRTSGPSELFFLNGTLEPEKDFFQQLFQQLLETAFENFKKSNPDTSNPPTYNPLPPSDPRVAAKSVALGAPYKLENALPQVRVPGTRVYVNELYNYKGMPGRVGIVQGASSGGMFIKVLLDMGKIGLFYEKELSVVQMQKQ